MGDGRSEMGGAGSRCDGASVGGKQCVGGRCVSTSVGGELQKIAMERMVQGSSDFRSFASLCVLLLINVFSVCSAPLW